MSIRKEAYKACPESVRYLSTLALNQLFGVKSPDMFTTIDVAFDDWCNRRCWYCPVSKSPQRHGPNGDILPQIFWERLLNDLSTMDFSGSLKAVHYNEPLLHAEDLLFPRYEQARAALPKCELMLYTNGDLLPKYLDRVVELGLSVVVGIHDPINPKTLEFLESDEAQRIGCLEVKNVRGMQLFNRAPNIPVERRMNLESCPNYTWEQTTLVINPRGDVVTCIQDHDGERVWGNIGQESARDIWNQREFWQFREDRRLNRETTLSICRACLGSNQETASQLISIEI